MENEPVFANCDGAIAKLIINRPQVMNALAASTIRAMRKALADLRRKNGLRVLIVTGAGRAFCAGADLGDPEIALDGEIADRPAKLSKLMQADINPLMQELQQFPLPTIAAVNGPAVGGGTGIALACDLVIASHEAYFMQVFTPRLGLVPDMGVTWHLERLVGRARARGLSMLGDRLSAVEAAEWGLIWKAAPADRFDAEVEAVARRIADAPPLAQAALRRLLDEAPSSDLSRQLDREREEQCRLVGTSDAQEAVLAFREKRQPRFTGR